MKVEAGTVHPRVVREVLAAYLAECEEAGGEPVSETYRFYQLMEKRIVLLGLDSLRPWALSRAQDKFRTQVLRELNRLAAEGTLVKRGEKRDLHFYTPAAAKAADDAAEARVHEAEAAKRRSGKISGRLAGLGLAPLVAAGVSIQLDPEDWEALLELAERG